MNAKSQPLSTVRSFQDKCTTATPFDMVVMNDLDRFHLVADVIDRLRPLGPKAAYAKQAIRDKHIEHKQYIAEHGENLPEIRHWKWGNAKTKEPPYATRSALKRRALDRWKIAIVSPFFAKPEMDPVRFQEQKIGDTLCLR